jgi:hypothetical protein
MVDFTGCCIDCGQGFRQETEIEIILITRLGCPSSLAEHGTAEEGRDLKIRPAVVIVNALSFSAHSMSLNLLIVPVSQEDMTIKRE